MSQFLFNFDYEINFWDMWANFVLNFDLINKSIVVVFLLYL